MTKLSWFLSLLFLLVGCSGPSDDTLLRELSASDAQDLCEEGTQDVASAKESTCLVLATSVPGTPEACTAQYNDCLAETNTTDCTATAPVVPESCTATVGDARACNSDSFDLFAQLAADRSCAEPGQPLPTSILPESCAAIISCVED